jgi:hypothetical protein
VLGALKVKHWTPPSDSIQARDKAMGSVSSGPNSSWEALLKYVHRHGYCVFCTYTSVLAL